MGVYDALRDQAAKDAVLTVKSLGIQLLVNLVVSLFLLGCVSRLRPLHYLAYPSSKTSLSEKNQKAALELGWIDWIRQMARVSDDFLIDRIGFDAVLFLRFIRTIRNLLIIMTVIAAAILMPINAIATRRTGDWPPIPWDLGLLSISSINHIAGKEVTDNDNRWYWSHILATWLFTALLIHSLHRSSNEYLQMRRQFYKTPAYTLSSRSLLLTNIPKYVRSNDDLKKWIKTTCGIYHPTQQTHLGRRNPKLMVLIEAYRKAVEHLEDAIAVYARDGSGRRPVVRPTKSRILSFTRKEPVDAIEHYTKRVSDLYQAIKKIPEKDHSVTDYGWVTFSCVAWANSALQAFNKRNLSASAYISPPANDLIWPNMSISNESRTTSLWTGRAYFTCFMVAWVIPVAALAAISNIVNMVRLYPESRDYIEKHWFIFGLVQGYIAPYVTAILFFTLPRFFLRLVKSQGYLTRSTSDQKVLWMLYSFFITNHFVLFTIGAMFIGIYGQLRQLVIYGELDKASIPGYTAQLAKNIADFSSFWINLLCVRAVGVSLEMVQVIPVITIRLHTLCTRPSPRRLKKLLAPPYFKFVQNYNIIIFFFTIAIVFSATSPLILPFSLIYFTAASFVYKYMLMYIYVTKVESGGRIWPAVFRTTMISMIVAQFGNFLMIFLKGGHTQAYTILPLIVLTTLFSIAYSRRLHRLAASVATSMIIHEDPAAINTTSTLDHQYRDPLLDDIHLMPIIHNDMRSLLSQIYPGYEQQQQQQRQQQEEESQSQSSTHLVNNSSEIMEESNAEQIIYSYPNNNENSPTNPYYNDDQITLYNPVDNRSVVFQTVSDQYFAPQKGCHHYSSDDPDHYREPSAPPLGTITTSPALSASRTTEEAKETASTMLQDINVQQQQQQQQKHTAVAHEETWDHRVVTVHRHHNPAPSLPDVELPTYTAALQDRPVVILSPPASPTVQALPRQNRRHSDPVIKYNSSGSANA